MGTINEVGLQTPEAAPTMCTGQWKRKPPDPVDFAHDAGVQVKTRKDDRNKTRKVNKGRRTRS